MDKLQELEVVKHISNSFAQLERNEHKFLLLGGNGFLGNNLVDELQRRNISFTVCDKDDIDLTNDSSIVKIANVIIQEQITDLVCLASNVGIETFNNEKSALDASIDNIKMLTNIVNSIKYAKRNDLNVSWYSTSEVFGSFTDYANFTVTTQSCRSAYSQIKILGETFFKSMKMQGAVKNVHIVRPFNPSGRYQTRGVVFDMFNTALRYKKIIYRRNTTRMISDVIEFTKNSLNDMLLDESTENNYYDSSLSMELKTLAKIIQRYVLEKFNIDAKIIEIENDPSVQFRHIGNLSNFDNCKEKIYKILDQM